MIMSRYNQHTNDLLVSNMKIEVVDNFEYLPTSKRMEEL